MNQKNKYFKNIRIVGGKWRQRKLSVSYYPCLRPTTNKAKETLFNWLFSIVPGAHCLDCFAGTGSLGIEALSRHAAKVTFVEKNKNVSFDLIKNIKNLDPVKTVVINMNLYTWLERSHEAYNIVFIDPPFRRGMVQITIQLLEKYNLLVDKAYVYVETEKKDVSYSVPNNWILHRKKKIGNVLHQLFISMK
ncbi:16S rRNA (guanine(966)-N(2))-methyltransferase RsmD [Blochmannia endosymbiont of Colobopsis nipponica]|uniref:16S rRNA (guanine(966)-N(2))-methyltransferase RsmD n=1 Tax=Blochmannia endosymbiont of Colobopsis nipponica TaxID=2681987 RepID=UPI0017816EA7|nr:16S rRNA (guanine(966)-N(2))-methyltransferase RsmD [Blochmannia endosymbiont of Colobopsis nipponica]QOI10846.1 16S rRNA (guanine(966)-N(2))-methyltransferase RsmD [Blochmannia endosymbiont of Colobopsis nipponica]